MKKLLLICFMMHFDINTEQNKNKVVSSAVLQALVEKLQKDQVVFHSSMHYRTAPGGNQATLSKKGILYDGCDKEIQSLVIGRYSDSKSSADASSRLIAVSIVFDDQQVKAEQSDARGQYLKLSDETIWRFWLDKDSHRWIFMKDGFEVLP